MPTPEEILQGLQEIANDFTHYAIMWHILFTFLLFALLLRWKPANNFLSALMALPLASVSIFAWITGNPFNGIVFGLFAILLFIFGSKNNRERIGLAAPFWSITGLLIVIYGLVYPHFIHAESLLTYFYASPVGLVPCPTLSTVIGFALILNGFRSKAWSVILVIIGLFYGIFGVLRLHVYLDTGLIIASLLLLIHVFSYKSDK